MGLIDDGGALAAGIDTVGSIISTGMVNSANAANVGNQEKFSLYLGCFDNSGVKCYWVVFY